MKGDPCGIKILFPTLLLCEGLRGEGDDVILTINEAESRLDVISAKFISLICHRSLWGETEL